MPERQAQHRNRDEAWKMLKSRLFEHEMRKRMAEQQKLEDSKTDVGWGIRFAVMFLISPASKTCAQALRSRILKRF